MINPIRRLFLAGAVIIAVAVFATPAFSELKIEDLPKKYGVKNGLTSKDLPDREGVRAGPLVVHAAAKVTEQFETNIFLNNTDRKADIITILSPSVGFELPVPLGDESGICADYEYTPYIYGTWNSENHTDQRVRTLVELNFADYTITATDTYRIFTNRADNEDSLKLKQDTNNFRVGVASTQFEDIGFDVGYSNKLTFYDSTALYYGQLTYEDKDYMDQAVDITASYRIMPKTFILLENVLGQIRYMNSSIPPGSFYDETLLGLRGEWSSKITINLRAGVRCQFYDKSNSMPDKSYIGPVVRGGFDYSPTDSDTITVALERTPRESTFSNMNYYIINVVNLAYNHQFNDKLSAGLSANAQYHQYPSEATVNNQTAKRHDTYLGGSANVRYDIQKWLSMEAKYTYTNRTSKFDVYDYFDNVLTISGTVGF